MYSISVVFASLSIFCVCACIYIYGCVFTCTCTYICATCVCYLHKTDLTKVCAFSNNYRHALPYLIIPSILDMFIFMSMPFPLDNVDALTTLTRLVMFRECH